MKRHVAWNLGGTIATAAIALASVPLYLHFYGPERYGVLATIWVVLGYFSVFDFGMGQAVINALAQTHQEGRDDARAIWWTALLLNLAVGAAVAIVALAVVLVVGTERIVASGGLGAELWRSLPYILLMIPLALIFPILIGNFDSRHQFAVANAHQVVASVLFQALPLLALLYFDATLPVAIAASVVGRALSCVVLVGQSIKRHAYWPPTFQRGHVVRLGSFGGWVALSTGAGALLESADRVIITSILGGAPTAWYSVSYSVVNRVRSLPQAILRTLYPRISADAEGSAADVALSVRTLSLILVPTISSAIFVIEPLFQLWIGSRAAAASVPLARIMLVGLFANCLAYMPLVAMQASGKPKRVALIHASETPVFLALMWLAAVQYGTIGAASVWALRVYTDAIIMFWAARMKKAFLQQGLFQSLLPLGCCLLTLTTPLPLAVQALIGVALLAAWAVADTYLSRQWEPTLNLLTLTRKSWLLAVRTLRRGASPDSARS